MPRFRVNHSYRTSAFAFTEGDVVELTEAQAVHIENDSPGALSAVDGDATPAAEDVYPGEKAGQAKVLAWVGDDPARAREALEAEERREQSRPKLVTRLVEIVDAHGAMSTEDPDGLTKG